MNPEPTNPYFLRVEGVNLSNFVFDTRDLSTIRGGGLALLTAIQQAETLLKGHRHVSDVRAISKGASVGFFSFSAASGADPEEIRTHVTDGLKAGAGITLPITGSDLTEELWLKESLTFATHVVDIAAAPSDENAFREANEELIAKNRWRQMQSGSLSVPEVGNSSEACELDGRRPHESRLEWSEKDGKQKNISWNVRCRRRYGQKRKRSFYRDFTTSAEGNEFANEFEHIATKHQGTLENKMAVFYADGNRFGATQTRLCKTAALQEKFDVTVRDSRRAFMEHFLNNELLSEVGWVYQDEGDKKEQQDSLRFETLLWGGDELMFVMPAWKGWYFARLFFEHFNDLYFEGNEEKKRLTHTGALVFCHHHSPIHRIKDLLKEKMAEFAKDIPAGRQRNQLIYQILESFDHLGTDFQKAQKRRLGDGHPVEGLVLAERDGVTLHQILGNLSAHIRTLKNTDFPRGQLRSLVNGIVTGKATGNIEEDRTQRLIGLCQNEAAKDAIAKLGGIIGNDWRLWIHLEELWDYTGI